MENVPVTDQIYFLGPGTTPATASFTISWTPMGPVRFLTPGSTDPTDKTNFTAAFRDAFVNVDFAEIGREQNGVFTRTHAHNP